MHENLSASCETAPSATSFKPTHHLQLQSSPGRTFVSKLGSMTWHRFFSPAEVVHRTPSNGQFLDQKVPVPLVDLTQEAPNAGTSPGQVADRSRSLEGFVCSAENGDPDPIQELGVILNRMQGGRGKGCARPM